MKKDPNVDRYIAKSAEFARPILVRLRSLVEKGCPQAEESIKWQCPHFVYKGNLCMMAAFKAHCGFGFWHHGMEPSVRNVAGAIGSSRGHFGRIERLTDMPSDADLVRLIREAAQLNEAGIPARSPESRKPKPEAKVPSDLAAALKKNKKADAAFKEFSPSHRREYIEWITDAKREETRAKRLATTLEWVSEGKGRNWKYESC